MCRSRDPRPKTCPDDFSVTRGREVIVSPTNVYSTGRGGAGNLHSPLRHGSREHPTPDAAEQEVIREYVAAHDNVPVSFFVSSPDGGIGNMTRSCSRDPNSDARAATSPVRHTTIHISHAVDSTGRGGAGNIYPGDGMRADVIDEEARRRVHLTGRGSFANLSSASEPAAEHHSVERGEYESAGRGGVSNIVHDTGKDRVD
ncbi:hypothetical protein BDN70DRAFT_818832 [Pholiota conissans]|uniref:Uncharacterized protein n=1 Tax=Pholiota conissans TaxID=109636 RepID=A0A9P5YNB5_9AGAR|nr:hypothetical protein BDN70DRAFT_818832 [Pholiota conissans]